MNLSTISQVSKLLNISTRTLRYYEQIGLLPSVKKDDYAYRTYDEAALLRLRQIVLLRKLRIPLKQISELLGNEEIAEAINIFQSNVSEIDEEIGALSTIRTILISMINRLNSCLNTPTKPQLFDDEPIKKIIDTLIVTKIKLKEEKSMEDLNRAGQSLNKLKDVRILYLPPVTVASSRYIGENPENIAGERLNAFVRNNELQKKKPDLRVFGFNNPCPTDAESVYGYEFWVTIPEDMDVPSPLTKKKFPGGLYAAHGIRIGNFEEWQSLSDWAGNNDEVVYDRREPLGMDGCLEEHLNAFTYYSKDSKKAVFTHLDLLIPVKEK